MSRSQCSNCGSPSFLAKEEEDALIDGILLRRQKGIWEDLVCANCGWPSERIKRQKLPLWHCDPVAEELADRERDEQKAAGVVLP